MTLYSVLSISFDVCRYDTIVLQMESFLKSHGYMKEHKHKYYTLYYSTFALNISVNDLEKEKMELILTKKSRVERYW